MVHDHACCHVGPPLLVRCHHAEVELKSIRKRRDSLRAAGILGYNDSFLPIGDVVSDPPSDQRLCVEIVDWALKEALHLRRMQIDRDDMFHASDMEEISKHPRGDGAAMRLLFRLSAVWEVGQHGYAWVNWESARRLN